MLSNGGCSRLINMGEIKKLDLLDFLLQTGGFFFWVSKVP